MAALFRKQEDFNVIWSTEVRVTVVYEGKAFDTILVIVRTYIIPS